MLRRLDELEARLAALMSSSPLPDRADEEWVDGWLHRSYLAYWARAGLA